MTNKMNIDMGDFFGSEPTKKETPKSVSRFGFGMMSKKTAQNRLSQGSKDEADDSFDNSFTNSPGDKPVPTKAAAAPKSPPNKTAPVKDKPIPSKVLTGKDSLSKDNSRTPSPPRFAGPEVKVTAKPVVPEPKLLPRVGSMRDPKPPQSFIPPPKGLSSTPPMSPVVISPKKSLLVLDTSLAHNGSSLTEVVDKAAKSPPPLPPRPLSPRNKHHGEHVKMEIPNAIGATSPTIETKQSEEITSQDRQSSSSPAKPINDKSSSVQNTTSSSMNESTRSEVAPWTVWSEDPEKTLKNEGLRAQVAPWTTWSEDPEKTLLNVDLRAQVAPWTSEPDPVPKRISSADEAVVEQSREMSMDAFFSRNNDDDGFGNEEFTNPMLNLGQDDEDNMISKPNIKKTAWFGTSEPAAASSSPTTKSGGASHETDRKASIAPIPQVYKAEKKKVIDFGEIFKAPAEAADDEDNAFMNDPEFKDAPDFEW